MKTVKEPHKEIRFYGVTHRLIGGRWVPMPKPMQTRKDYA